MIRVAINGYGRIGRVAHRVIIEKFKDQIEVVAINAGSSTDIKGWMYLLKYDTSYHLLNSTLRLRSGQELKIESSKLEDNEKVGVLKDAIGYIIIDEQKIPVFSQKDPSLLPWRDLNVDVVIESTGAFTTEEKLKPHLTAGAKKVILSAPFKDEATGSTYVLGVNLNHDSNVSESIISNASCTTNCIAPVADVVENSLGIEKAMMTTIHAYTSDQRIQDGGHKDYRRARTAAQNIIPTSTGATKAAAKAIPTLNGIFNGLAIRVPVATGSLSDFTFLVKKQTSVEEVNQILENASHEPKYQGILEVTRDPIVSSDIIGNTHSSIIDLSLTQVVGGNMVKIIAWYDNEYGYANRLVEETIVLGKSAENQQQTANTV